MSYLTTGKHGGHIVFKETAFHERYETTVEPKEENMHGNWKATRYISITWPSISQHLLSYGDTGKLGRNFRVASTRRQSLRIARKTDARDCIMCLHECTRVGAWYDAVVVQRHRATTGSVANSWNRTLATVSFRDFKMLAERKETRAKYQTDRFTDRAIKQFDNN